MERGRRFDKNYIRKILVMRMDRLGDFVITTPLLKALKKDFPFSEITLLARRDICELAETQPWIDDCIACERPAFLFSFLKLARKVKGCRFDLVIDCLKDYTLMTAVIAYASCAPYRLGFDVAKRGIFFNLKVSPTDGERTMAEETLALARRLGIISNDSKPEIIIDRADKPAIDDFMNANGIMGKSFFVGIHPAGFYPSQRWSSANFAELIDRLSKSCGINVVLMGDKNDMGLLNVIKDMAIIKPYIFCAKSLNLLAALIDKLDLFIGNNSGPLHMAAALGKMTVSTIGPTDSRLWTPKGEGHIILKKDVSCSPCNRPICKDHRCMELITVDEMFKAASQQLEKIKRKDE